MTPIKRKLLYIFRDSLLRLRISWNNQSLTLSVGYHVDRFDSKGKQKWNGTRCRINSTHGVNKIPAGVINKVLDQLEDKITRAFAYYENEDEIPSSSELKSLINGVTKPRIKSVFDAFEEFISEGKNIEQWKPATVRKMKTMRALLQKFKPDVQYSDFDTDFMKSLAAYQTTNAVVDENEKAENDSNKEIIKYKGRYQNSTINKNLNNFKWFLRWSYNKGYIKDIKFLATRISFKTAQKPVIFLTWEELIRMYNIDLSSRPELEKTRDMFCFCCFTSLRYSDIANLKWANVNNDYIKITTIKTTDSLIIDLNDYSREILNKYRYKDSTPFDTIFQTKSQQKMNNGLKVIGELCEINTPVSIVEMYGAERKEYTLPKYKLLSTHAGRRTFICNALALGIAPNIVMKWTGHSDYNAMKPYIDIADSIRKESMSLFNRKS